MNNRCMMPASPFHHIALNSDEATQRKAHQQLLAAGYKEPDILVLEHGYCRSLYATDPNGMIVELTVDQPEVAHSAPARQASAHAELKCWRPATTLQTTHGGTPP